MLCIYSPFCSFKRSCIWAFKCFFILSLACVSLPKLLYWTWHLSGISAQVKIKFLVISLEVKSEKKLTKHLSDNSWICSRLNTSKFWTFLFVIWKKKSRIISLPKVKFTMQWSTEPILIKLTCEVYRVLHINNDQKDWKTCAF